MVRPGRHGDFPALPTVAAILLSLTLSSCSQSPRPRVVAPVLPAAPAGPSLIDRSSDLFYSGKKAALSGDFECAEAQFQLALNAVVPPAGPRPEAADVTEFSASLYESIRRYEAMAQTAAEADPQEARDTPDELVGVSDQNSPADLAAAREEVKTDERASAFDLPIAVNEQVLNMVASFSSRPGVRHRFEEGLQRAGRYMPMIRAVLEREGLPRDLAYVAMIESSFKTRARSRARAQGVWQFIGATGRRYGLHRTASVDERSDPVKATEAAAGYFKDLHEIFNDWYLVMAAYNAGEGKILRAMDRTGARDFWQLAATSAIRRQTANYVPAFLASLLISKDPSHYGFDVTLAPPLDFERVTLDRSVDLRTVAGGMRIAYEDLQALNPELRSPVTPREPEGYDLRIPPGARETFLSAFAAAPTTLPPLFKTHTAKKGETLPRIAKRYGISVTAIADANSLSPRAKVARGQEILIPQKTAAVRKSTPTKGAVKAASAAPPASKSYRVKNGDTLYRIALRHGVTVAEILAINGLGGTPSLKAGDKISIPAKTK